jgi:aryl-alcohol dehydrogenase-like predicted oxidoreductase/histidinol phosphatase-like enzyme
MRLSTANDRDDARSIAVIHAALDAGVTLLDTADAYCRDESEVGHNERLIADALKQWGGDRSSIEVATKGGLRRPKGAWVNEGRGKYLREACEASRRALDVDAIDLYQLHAVDPRTPIETSVRALAALHRDGKVRRIGLCNVTVGQIETAREIAEISAVQVSLSVLDDDALRDGVAEYCREHGIELIAYRPLGGERLAKVMSDPLLREIASSHEVSPALIALAWLADLAPRVTPIPGATHVATARSIGDALRVRLTDDDRTRLDARFHGRLLRVPRSMRRPPNGASGDVVVVMGMPGAGKSTIARELETAGYERLNRDERGGSLSDLLPELEKGLAAGRTRWVLDNTYPSRRARNEVIESAWAHGVPARCIWLNTELSDAQINAITRMLSVHGRLPTPEEIRKHAKEDTRYFGPDAQFRYERTAEPPSESEGFERVEERHFVRHAMPNATARAIFLELDDVLCTSLSGTGPALSADDIVVAPRRRETLGRFAAEGWLLFAQAWRPHIARSEMSLAQAEELFARARDLLGLDITIRYCPHDAGPPICWCRKPLPGLALEFALARGVALDRSLAIGRSPADRTLSQRLGLTYHEAETFFAD